MRESERTTFVLAGGAVSTVVTSLLFYVANVFWSSYIFGLQQIIQFVGVSVAIYLLFAGLLLAAKMFPTKNLKTLPTMGVTICLAVMFENIIIYGFPPITTLIFSFVLSLIIGFVASIVTYYALVQAEIMH